MFALLFPCAIFNRARGSHDLLRGTQCVRQEYCETVETHPNCFDLIRACKDNIGAMITACKSFLFIAAMTGFYHYREVRKAPVLSGSDVRSSVIRWTPLAQV